MSLPRNVTKLLSNYGSTFKIDPIQVGFVHCTLCQTTFKATKKDPILKHIERQKHKDAVARSSHQSKISLEKNLNKSRIISQGFLKAGLPLHKLDHPAIKEMFEQLGYKSCSTNTARNHLDEIYDEEIIRIKDYVHDRSIFIQIDESRINEKRLCAILIGDLEKPEKTCS